MAYIYTEYYSTYLAKITGFNLILPNDYPPEMIVGNDNYKRHMKTLYLLHGYSESAKAWLFGSLIQELAGKYNLAVVMPEGNNSFYLDQKGTGKSYCSYIGRELVEYTRKTFGLSDQKDDTYIGGNSMGGFGAIHTSLIYPETFSKVVAFSPALIIHKIKGMQKDNKDDIADFDYYTSVFGDLNQLEDSDNNPEYLVNALKEKGSEVPPIYMACGTEDFLIEQNRSFYSFLRAKDVEVQYNESTGDHNWTFWNQYLEQSIKWLLAQ